jgi:hypothetical protein
MIGNKLLIPLLFLVLYWMELIKSARTIKSNVMKTTAATIVITLIISACGNPIHVTTRTDAQATTSGTLGGVRAENQLPRRSVDSARTIDTTRIKREGRKAD